MTSVDQITWRTVTPPAWAQITDSLFIQYSTKDDGVNIRHVENDHVSYYFGLAWADWHDIETALLQARAYWMAEQRAAAALTADVPAHDATQ